MVAAGEDDPLDALQPDGLVQVVEALDVAAEDGGEGVLQRDAAEVDHGVDAADGLPDGGGVAQVEDECVLGAVDRPPVGEPQPVAVRGSSSRSRVPTPPAAPVSRMVRVITVS